MATVYTRASKGSALTWTEGDANINNLNNDKIELTNLSVTDSGGDGSLSYNNTSGVFTYTGPSATEVRAHFSAGTGITITSGVIATTITQGITDLVQDTTPQLGGALDVNGQKIVSISNGNIELEPNGTGDVYLTADTVRIGDANANATITTNGTGDLILNTNAGTNSGSITIADGANGDITILTNGTGTINFSDDVVRAVTLKDYAETINSLGTTSGTITPDVANGNVQTITLNGNLTFSAFSNPVAGQSMTLIINTGGTSRTLTSTMKFAGGSKTLSTTNTTDIISVFYDGTTYWASLSKGFV